MNIFIQKVRTKRLASSLSASTLAIALLLGSFTQSAYAATHSFWDDAHTPAVSDSGDASSTELGLRFIPSVDGRIAGVKFYKDPLNTGTHIGNLWTRTGGGTNLASVVFTDETASGWQTAYFSNPVPVSAGSEYVISYFAPNGHYSFTSDYFLSGSYTNGPLSTYHIGPGSNGVYNYSPTSSFPDGNVGAPNYWVDVIFDDGLPPPDTTPPTVTVNQSDSISDPSNIIQFTVEFSEDVTGFSADSVTISGTTTDIVEVTTVDAHTYIVTITGVANGETITASIAAGVVTDTAGNQNLASTSTDNSITYLAASEPPTINEETVGTPPQSQPEATPRETLADTGLSLYLTASIASSLMLIGLAIVIARHRATS